MNRIYKLKFDKRRNELVVVSEITAGMGKEKSTGHIADLAALSPFRKLLGTLTPVALLTGLIAGLLPAMVLAADLPTGGQIVGGQGSISTSGNQMTIHQQTQNMATNWHSFDIGKNNTVQFVQPDSSSVALNRVTGASGSQIMGTLKANGQVFILNPNGVLFGKDARVNVGGLVASTKNISTADFMKGQYSLSGSGNPGAQVVNQGSLTTTKGGYIVLAGERVSNSGTVTTPGGKTVLAAGKTVTLQLDNGGLTSVSVNGSVVNALVENRGLISATNGQVYLTAKGQDMLLNTVVNNSGTVEAKGLASRGGEIVLNGGDSGVVSQSGHLLAGSQTGQGGKITLEGQNIHLAGGSLTSATGKTGGGEVYVGGGWQGQDSRIKNASKVVMDKTATVDVSATDAGNGGTAVLWSDDYTNFRGTVLAKGGALSGNGGRVETSSHRNLQAYGEVDASARAGRGGDWLLDPTDVTIVGSGVDTGIGSATADGTDIFTPTASGAQILNSSIVNQLNAGANVTVKTSGTDTEGQTGNITVNAGIVKTSGADAKLTLLADNNISTADNIAISASSGKLNLDLLAGNTTNNASITLGKFINISLNGGDFLAGAANPDNAVSLTYSNNGQIHGGNVTLNLTRGLNGYAYKVQADNDLTINGPVNGGTGWSVPLSFIAGGNLEMNSPTSISLNAAETTNGGGKVVISGDKGVSLSTTDGDILLSAASAATNSVNVSSVNGAVAMSSGGNLTLVCATVTHGAGQDITLEAAGKNSARVNITGSTINSNGGNISIDHAAEGQAMTILISGSTLNTSATNDASHKGNITLSAYNPNVDLTVSSLTSTVRNGGAMIEIGNNSNLTGDNIATVTTQDGSNGKGLPLYMHGATLQADGNISLSGVASGGATPAQLELRGGGNSLTSVNGNISLISDKSGVWIDATGSSRANITSGGNMTISGSGGNNRGVEITNAVVSASKNLNVTGSTAGGVNNGNGSFGGVFLSGNVDLHSPNGSLTGAESNKVFSYSGGVVFGGPFSGTPSDIVFDGNFSIAGTSDVGRGGMRSGAGIYYGGKANVTFCGGNFVIRGTGRNMSTGMSGARAFENYRTTSDVQYINLEGGANLNIILNTAGTPSLMAQAQLGLPGHTAGYVFSGNGNVSINASNRQYGPDSATIQLNSLNNVGLNGSFNVNATNGLGTAILITGYTTINLANANITGTGGSKGGEGIKINSARGTVNLNNVTLRGVSLQNNGIDVSGNTPISVINSVLNGTTSANGVGVRLTGGSSYILDGASITGKSVNGSAVSMTGPFTVNNGTSVTGTATGSGSGVSATGSMVTAHGDSVQINGTAVSGNGIILVGNTVLTGARLTGNATTGTGLNVSGNATLTNATVSGETQTGTGAVVSGKLTADDTTQVTGKATQDGGTGVTLNGAVTGGKVDGTATSGTAVQIADGGVLTNAVVTGNATTGTGLNVSGNATLTNATLNGSADSGVGVNIAGNLTTDSATQVNGLASGGTGVNLGASLTGASVKGTSDTGAGVQLADHAVVTGAILNGSSTSGDGMAVTGNVTLDDTSATALKASSTSGTGLRLADNANVSIQTITSVTQAKKDADGNPVLDADGNAVMETITTQAPVITPVTLTGTSVQGTGVATEGNVSVSGVVLNGSTTADTGTGVSLGGNLTIADNISGVTAGATGNGTALVVNNASIHSDGYTDSGKDFVINASVSGSGTAIKIQGSSQLDEVVLNGTATGGGTAVELGGKVTGANITGTSDSGNAVQIADGGVLTNAVVTGNATTGTGVNVSGNATLTNATVSGETQTGTGAVVSGKLTADDTTQVTGKATQDGGTGVTLNGTVTGGKVDGVSGQGTGLQLADNAVVTDATLKGTSTSGSGVAVTGNISLDDTTAAALNATSGSGAGLSLEDSANVSIVSITTVMQEKKGPDGNTVADATGNPVMETITMTTPVTTPVTLTGISQSGSGVATSGNVSISGVVLNGSSTSAGGSGATLGGNLTIADDISGITVNATGNGTGLVMDNVTVNADGYTSTGKNFVINASTSDSSGTAIRTQGNNQLAGVTLNGSADNGGTAVVLGGQVSGASVTGTSDSGTAVRVSDTRLTNTVVTGNATGNGTGVALSGAVSLDKTTAEALNAVSSGGTGLSLEQSANVIVTGLDAATTAELKGISQSGSGITTAGNVAIRGIVLNGSTSTSGVGVTLGGNLTIGDHVSRVTAGATGSGTALVIDNATLQANGYAGTNKGPVILADASGTGGTAVKIQGDNQLNDVAIVGCATSDGGTGVLLDGQVTGANISGTAGSGTAVVVTDGTIISGGIVKGGSHSGTGLATDGNVTLNNALISGDAQGDSGTGVSLNGSITGGTVNGTSTSGDAVRIKDALLTGTEVNGVSQSGAGVKTQGNVTLKSTGLSATSENGITDLDVSGALNRDQYSVINADRIAGQENIHVLQPDTPPSPGEGGATGSGDNATPDTGDSGGVAGGDTGAGESGGAVTPPSGGTGGDAGNNGNTGSATGSEGSLPDNNTAQPGGAPGPAIREQILVSALRQQAVNAQVTRMNQAAQDGFHSAATPVVPVTGYQAKPQNVEISLCDGDSCQPESLDAARPAEGVVTSSGK
ncbi:filamentous hemagglutinin N-terminal domain-containing protein [Salmonella enterica]|nr:filamentous hemagglutinin N-terminal domain-containing protein [Salmonella enterica]